MDNKFSTYPGDVNTARWLRRAGAILAAVVLSGVPKGSANEDKPAALVFHKVDRGDVVRTLTERGVVEPANAAELVCRVRSRGPDKPASTIRSMVDEGTHVKKGDKLLELDDSSLREELFVQNEVVKISRVQADSSRAMLKTWEQLAQINEEKGKLLVEAAQQAVKQSESRGDLLEKRIKLRVVRAERALEYAKLQAAEMQNKSAGKLLIQIAEADLEEGRLELQLRQEEIADEKARRKNAIRIAVEEAKRTTEEAKRQKATTQSELEAALGKLKAEEEKLENLKKQVSLYTLHAPQDGIVLYVTPRSPLVLGVGEPVSEGQRLLQVSDLRRMRVRVRVHEALTSLVRRQQSARAGVDALNRTFPGEVTAVAAVAEAADWLSSDVKVFSVLVDLQGVSDGLKPGMSASVTLVVDQRKNVLRVPVQAVVREKGKAVCYVKGEGEPEKRELVVGLSDDKYVEVKEGLREGEAVLLNPRTERSRPRPKDSEGGKTADTPATIVVRSVKPATTDTTRRSRVTSYGITWADYERFAKLPGVSRLLPMRLFPQEVRRLEKKANGRVVATISEYRTAAKLDLEAGRFLSDEDERQTNNVVVLGADLARELFPDVDPLGESVQVGKYAFKVVGVVKGSAPARTTANLGDNVYIPLQTCRARFGETIIFRQSGSVTAEKVELSRVLLSVDSPNRVRATAEVVREMLERSHKEKDWEVIVPGTSSEKK
jgi:RND family efflux transporter MFP subunit